jgi:hypothetical protein
MANISDITYRRNFYLNEVLETGLRLRPQVKCLQVWVQLEEPVFLFFFFFGLYLLSPTDHAFYVRMETEPSFRIFALNKN